MSERPQQAIEALVLANHILSNEGILDAFGHVSVRNPDEPGRFFLSRSLSPQLVQAEDIMEFDLDGNETSATGYRPYKERILHAKIYAARPDVQAVCHHHAISLIPFSTTGVEVRPICHIGGMFYEGVPVYDDYDVSDGMLIVNPREGERIARTLNNKRAVLLRGHGCIVVGEDIRRTVMASIYLVQNAEIQYRALQLGTPSYLSYEEGRAATETMFGEIPLERAWTYWCHRALAADQK
ncbi:MAG: class II aldolase/adducin family protein [Alicyclobacillus macrosporangiidus]|uniref:class II aldolase/adducin family protein n=1 Tax=Alicyclobacillus macrosporangiidus TaxID=392015 RepID=UPI0026EABE2F|nr:class II aldolase/adducin family protein [Alicyclobacillus macrosporangiidus]MCL6598121.1 class II aldolase/adducin family protein [Alicyclobacillus macrosporangiidus]